MGLIKCPDCEKMFSDRIEACPHCGCPKAAAIAEINKTQANTDNQTTINGAPVVKVVLPEELTVKKRENIPIQRSQVIEVEQQSNEKLGMKWFNFITKVRPWISITASVAFVLYLIGLFIIANIAEGWAYENVVLIIACSLLLLIITPNIVLQSWLLNKAYKNTITIHTMKSYFIWEIILGIPLDTDPVATVVKLVLHLILNYFVWYKCNMKYFRKRLPEDNDDNIEISSASIETKNLKFKEEAPFVQYPSNQESVTSSRTIRKKEKNRIQKKRITIMALSCAITFIVGLGIIFIPIEYKYQKACEELNNRSFSTALLKFEELNGYRDSEEKINETKYKYVLQNRNNSNSATYTFLKELRNQNYKDSAELYAELYQWQLVGIVINTTENNETVPDSYIRRNEPVYIHFKLVGGTPFESEKITIKHFYPDGDNSQNTSEPLTDGESSWFGWQYENPETASTGTYRCEFYDESGNLIGRGSVKITE